MQTRTLFTSVIAALIAVPVFAADPTPGDKTVTSKQYVDSNIAQKQDIITKKADANYSMTFPTTTGGAPGQRQIITNFNNVGTSDTTLATSGAIKTELNKKQVKLGLGNPGDVVAYGQQPGEIMAVPVYDSTGSYADQERGLVEAQHVNGAVTNGFNAHITCANPPDCTLWQVNQLSGTYVPQNQ